MSQWVVRVFDKCVLLPANITSIEVKSSQKLANELNDIAEPYVQGIEDDLVNSNPHEYWVCVRYYDICAQTAAKLPKLSVLCGVDTNCAAERIMDKLLPAMFARHGQDMYVDFSALLMEDFSVGVELNAAIEAATEGENTQTGRFIDLDEVGVVQSAKPRTQATVERSKLLKRIDKAVIRVVPQDHANNVEDYEKTIGQVMRHDRERSMTGAEPVRGTYMSATLPAPGAAITTAIPSVIQDSNVPIIGMGVARGDAYGQSNEGRVAASDIQAMIANAQRIRTVQQSQPSRAQIALDAAQAAQAALAASRGARVNR